MSNWDPPTPDTGQDPVPSMDEIDRDQALLGIEFGDAFRAQEFLVAMQRLNKEGALRLRDAVIVSKDESGDVKVRETIDPQPGRAALSGAVWSGLIGLFVGGPVGWVAGLGIGAGAGAAAAKVIDLGVPDDWVKWFREAVSKGTTTVIVLAEDVYVGKLRDEVARFRGAELVHSTLPAHAIDQIRTALAEG